MFQGTLESNLGEGAAVVRAYNALGYAAVAIGNHEFDFGPAGPAHVPGDTGADPRGALKARAREARYPFLAANLRQGKPTGPAVRWPNVQPWVVVQAAGVRVGLVGVTTIGTPRATHPNNFAGLAVAPLARSIADAARAARKAGAVAVIVLAHAGRALLPVRSARRSRELRSGRGDLRRGPRAALRPGRRHRRRPHPPGGRPRGGGGGDCAGPLRRPCLRPPRPEDRSSGWQGAGGAPLRPPDRVRRGGVLSFAPDACHPPPYEGRPVAFDRELAAVLAPDVARAAELRDRPVGIRLRGPLRRAVREESALGNFAADLLRGAHAGADVGFINGGSLRADLPDGPLRYGDLYQAFPFDDGIAVLRLTGAQLTALVARNLGRDAGILSLSGVRARARCGATGLEVSLLDGKDQPIAADRPLVAVTNGYLASGGDGLLEGSRGPSRPTPPRCGIGSRPR